MIQRQEDEEEELIQSKPVAAQITPVVQRQAEEEQEEPVQMKPLSEQITPLIQRQGEEEEPIQAKLLQRQPEEAEEEEEAVQAKGNLGSTPSVSPSVENGINSIRSGGQPLSESSRTFFEPRFSADFRGVRVHTDSNAANLARSVNAKAFTVGRDVVFGSSQYSPETLNGKKLMAHELTHVVQQNQGERGTLQQKKSCPSHRPKGEREQSKKTAGILANNVFFDSSANKLFIQDFVVNSDNLPPGVINTSPWQRVMSIIAGTPSGYPFVGVFGYSDCLGSKNRNTALRDERAKAVYNAMPTIAQVKVLMKMGDWSNNFITTNDTAANRAKNRAVIIKIAKITGPKGMDLCDFSAVASDLDQYMFLVRCLEKRLGLTSMADAPKTLSVLRQIYYGNASWTSSGNRNKIWDDVITKRPWSPGTDPSPKLGKNLFKAIQKSQRVFNNGQMLDIGHLLTGMDASLKPQDVEVNLGRIILQTNVANHEWATWAGDLGSAAAYHTFCVSFLNFTSTYNKYFKKFASNSDLEGDIDSYGNWAWLDSGTTSPDLQLNKPLSEVLMQYYRLTNTKAGKARSNRFEIFINFYGGGVKSGKLTKRSKLEKELVAPVIEFALLFLGDKVLKAYKGILPTACVGTPPPKSNKGRSVGIGALIRDAMIASGEMTKLFVDWLEKKV